MLLYAPCRYNGEFHAAVLDALPSLFSGQLFKPHDARFHRRPFRVSALVAMLRVDKIQKRFAGGEAAYVFDGDLLPPFRRDG